MDAATPPACLSAKYKESFAYTTIKDRLPVILAKIADTVHRSKTWVKEDGYPEGALEDLKTIAGCLSKLRNEGQTNKPLIPIEDGRSDMDVWNKYLRDVTERDGQVPAWFISPWLYVECYMYRRVQEAVEKSTHLKGFDVFSEQKKKALTDSTPAILALCGYMMSMVQQLEKSSCDDVHSLFRQLSQVALWGNKCDLSISAGMENAQTSCALEQVAALKEYILVDDLDKVWSCLSNGAAGRVDIVLDNAGFELVTDLCLAEFLLSSNLATCIHFHAKAIPWFVSDVTTRDFDHTQQFFMKSNSLYMNFLIQRWRKRLDSGSWKVKVHDFWTMPFAFQDMEKHAPDLYKDISTAKLIFFKGDLNYRKLVGDRNWPTTTPFETTLMGFHPAPLCALRTLKADLVSGLSEGQAEMVGARDKTWMVNGNWAIMSYCGKVTQ